MRAVIFYATREGQTRRIAERIAAGLRHKGAEADVFDVRSLPPIDWSIYSIACVAASVHLGHHEPEMVTFVKTWKPALDRLSAAFISVSLSAAGAGDYSRSYDERQRAAEDVQRMIDVFLEETRWRPERTFGVAGRLAYTKYNMLVRFFMKRIARKAGAPTDTSRDYEFTDWPAIDRFVEELAAAAPAATA